MMALPKAKSQGSNGAGGGAIAFTGMSAARAGPVRAEPEIIASAVASNTIFFFMTIPITFPRTGFPAPPRAITPDRGRISFCDRNLICLSRREKQKKCPSADFLGVLRIP